MMTLKKFKNEIHPQTTNSCQGLSIKTSETFLQLMIGWNMRHEIIDRRISQRGKGWKWWRSIAVSAYRKVQSDTKRLMLHIHILTYLSWQLKLLKL